MTHYSVLIEAIRLVGTNAVGCRVACESRLASGASAFFAVEVDDACYFGTNDEAHDGEVNPHQHDEHCSGTAVDGFHRRGVAEIEIQGELQRRHKDGAYRRSTERSAPIRSGAWQDFHDQRETDEDGEIRRAYL